MDLKTFFLYTEAAEEEARSLEELKKFNGQIDEAINHSATWQTDPRIVAMVNKSIQMNEARSALKRRTDELSALLLEQDAEM